MHTCCVCVCVCVCDREAERGVKGVYVEVTERERVITGLI